MVRGRCARKFCDHARTFFTSTGSKSSTFARNRQHRAARLGSDKAIGITRCRSLDELLDQCDVLSLHCPLNDETRHLIDERELARLKPGAFVVNTARGAVIRKDAILAALRSGHLGGAGLDVVEDEPLRTQEEAATPNLIVTCHAAFCSVESKIEMRSTSARIALAAVTGAPLENVVNGIA